MDSCFRYFGLKDDPFRLLPDLEYYCDIACQSGFVDRVKSIVDTDGCIVKITADAGIGKTMLSKKLAACLDSGSYDTCIVEAAIIDNAYLFIAKKLSVQIDVASNVFDEVVSKIHNLYACKKKLVVIIDQADDLALSVFKELSVLCSHDVIVANTLSLVFFAHSSLNKRLYTKEMEFFLQRISASLYLSPMMKNDIDMYVQHRLIIAGHSNGKLFSRSAKKTLQKYSHGIPRIVNMLSAKAILHSFQRDAQVVEACDLKCAMRESLHVLTRNNIVIRYLWEICMLLVVILLLFICLFAYNIVYLYS